MAVVLPLLVILLFGNYCPTSRAAAGDEHGLTGVVDMQSSSLKPHAAACSGHRAVIPPHKGTWAVPLYRHLGPCSPASSSSSTGAAKAPSLADLLHQDQLRVDHIHRRLSSSWSEGVRVSKQAGPVKEPVRSEVIHLHDQPVIQVTIGSERNASGGAGGGGQQSQAAAGVVQTVVLDTASDVPWVQCHPSSSSATDMASSSSSSYDPARSSTYAAMACNSAACAELGRLYRGACVNNQCQYRVPITNSRASSSSSGTYGSDVLALAANPDPADGTISFKFGCSHAEAKQGEDGGAFDNATAGVMALGGGPESLASQTAAAYGSAFSYCIPATKSRRPGFFVLGSGVPANADPSAAGYAVTPMLRYARVPTFYRVRLLAIAVDGERLNVTPSVFAAGAVVDSRTAVTRLPPTAYQALREAFRSRMAMYREAPPLGSLDTCYDFSGAFFGVVMVPRIALLFDGDAVVALDPPAVMFHDCLAFAPNADDRMAGILGNVQQQTMEVLYNVGAGSVGFRRGAC